MRPRIVRAFGAMFLAVSTLATVVSTSPATSPAAAASTPEPPTLTSATFIPDSVSGDHVHLLWNPSPSEDVVEGAVYADGEFLFRGPVFENPFFGHLADVFLDQRGLTGDETFTLTAIDSQGNESAPSNGLTAAPLKELPAPALTSAVIQNNQLVLTWEPSHTDEVSGNISYGFIADNGQETGGLFGGIVNATTAATGLTISDPDDPTVPPINITEDTKISIRAADRTTAMSPLSNQLTPTIP